MLRAIYIGDVKYSKCNVFEYNVKTNKFHMIDDNAISYPFEVVMNDRKFILFATDGITGFEGQVYHIENQDVDECYNE